MRSDIADSAIVNSATDDTAWAERSDFWLKKASTRAPRSSARRRLQKPLILTGHGVSLRIHQGTLIVRNGLTHYPQEQEQWQLFPGKWRLPSRIVVLDGKGALSFHALRWLTEQNIQLVHIDWQGELVHVVGGSGYAIDCKLAEAQRQAQSNGIGLKLSRELIAQKIDNSIETLRAAFPPSPPIERSLQMLEKKAKEMKLQPPASIDALLGIEGRAGYTYFNAWRSFPLRWKQGGRRPIPDEWRCIGKRSSFVSGSNRPNRHATHPVNAMLNYAYGVLETQVRAHTVGAGLDPTLGFFHGKFRGKAALVYDLMEPLRPLVDREVLRLVRRNIFSPEDFMLTTEGVCRLNPELARKVVRETVTIQEIDDRVHQFVTTLLRRKRRT